MNINNPENHLTTRGGVPTILPSTKPTQAPRPRVNTPTAKPKRKNPVIEKPIEPPAAPPPEQNEPETETVPTE